MDQSYLIEMLERAFLLQHKRVWSLQTLRKLDAGKIFSTASEQYRKQLRQSLESNLRIAHETIDELAKEFGFEAGFDRLFDPTFVIGIEMPELEEVDGLAGKISAQERNLGIFNYRAMCRELEIRHEPYLETIHRKVLADVEFYRACQNMELARSPGPDSKTDPE